MTGYGKFLRVNLSDKSFSVEEIPEDWPKLYGGGRGFGAKLLYDRVPDFCDPFGEENKLIFCTGILSGTNLQAFHRWIAITKSPLTDGYCRALGGSTFGAFMRFAGYDCIIIEGKSETPVYLSIADSGCQFRDASHMWGKDTAETQKMMKEELGGGKRISTVAIGQAGENRVLYAGIFCDRRSASRGGCGAVMGAKNLKGIGIVARKNLDHLFDGDGIKELSKKQAQFITQSEDYRLHKYYGTTDGMLSRNGMGIFPTKNFRSGHIDGWENLTGDHYMKLRIGNEGCYICGALCGKVHEVKDGDYKGAISEGPEYESYWAFTGPIDSVDIGSTIMADKICDDYGLDSISTGVAIGFAFELFEKGIITKEDTDGLELNYGDHGVMIELIHKIGRYEGFGKILSMGVKRMSELYGKGSSDYAMHVKGMEFAGYEPRGLKATGYGYATSNIGGAHGAGALAFQEWGLPFPRLLDRFEDFGKEDVVIHNQNNCAVSEIGVVCAFSSGWGFAMPLYGPMLAAATGIEEFNDFGFRAKMGDRIYNLERVFLIRQGTTCKDDTLPKRITEEKLPIHGIEGEGQVIGHLPEVLQDYYTARGWDKEGIPTKEKLESMGLGYTIPDLERILSANGRG